MVPRASPRHRTPVPIATPVLADETTGYVATFDAATRTLVLADRTRSILPADFAMPETLEPGERVRIAYRSDADNGWKTIHAITRVAG